MYSFEPKKSPQVQSRIRRMLDLTVPNLSRELARDRFEDRNGRVIPALLGPWKDNAPVVEQMAFVVTRDFSSEGVGLVLREPFFEQEVLLGFWLGAEIMEQPWFFLGTAQHLREFGGGFWTLGLHLTEFVGATPLTRFATLAPFLERLQAEELVQH
jgi:hypothetical protein